MHAPHAACRCSPLRAAQNVNGSTQRLARPAPPAARGMSDGFRLPGRSGEADAAAVLVPLVNRPEGLTLLLTQRSAGPSGPSGPDQFPRRARGT